MGKDGVQVHREATPLGRNTPGKLYLWPVKAELPFVLPQTATDHTSHDSATLVVISSSGPREAMQAFRDDITIEVGPSGQLRYTHSWGIPGCVFAQRSRCDMVRATGPCHTPP